MPRSLLERAQALADRAYEAVDVERRITLAEQALQLSSDCADAYTILSQFAGDPRQALLVLELGLKAAERVLGPDRLEAGVGEFWSIPETRPYMRVRLALAECLWSIGCGEDSVDHLFRMLELNPGDNQGIRYILAAHLLDLGRDDDFDRLIEKYDEPVALLMFSRALREFRRSGDSAAARKLLARARAANPHVVPQLLHPAPSDHEAPETFSRGHPDEAELYAADFGAGWKQTPGALTWLRDTVARESKRPAKPPAGATPAVKKQLEKLPQSYGTLWQAAITRVPSWLRDGESMVRPWSILIVNHSDHLIIGQQMLDVEPSPELVFDRLARAMRKPLAGKAHRPSEIQVREEPLWIAVRPHLEEIGIDCIFRTELDEADFILDEMQNIMRPQGQPPGLVETPTFTSAQGEAFYAAAAEYFRRAPWRHAPSNVAIQVECPQLREFGPGRWYAIVMGQAGQTLGLAIYADMRAVEQICGGCCSAEEGCHEESCHDVDPTALSLIFGENFEIPIDDLIAAEKHRWPLAGPEAYPLVLCTRGETETRPLEAWELQLLEGCVRTIPDFLKQHPYVQGPAQATLGPVPSANLKFTLSWFEPEAGECGEDCQHCEHG